MKGLKKVLNFGAALALSISLVGCSTSEGDNGDSQGTTNLMDSIKSSGKLVVGTSAEFPPFEFHKDGDEKVLGVDAMIADEFAKDLGVKVEFKEMDFDGLVGALSADKIDVILAGMSPTEEREKSVDFTDLYYISYNAVIVKAGDENKIKSEEDLKKLRIGVQKGSIQEEYVRDDLKAENFKSLAGIPDLVLELKNGNIDAIVTNEAVSMINTKVYDGIKVANTSIGEGVEEGMAAAIKQTDNNKELLDLLNKKIKELKDSGKIDDFLDEASTIAAESGQQ